MSDEGTKSKFNAGVALAERLDGLQKAINMCRFNLTAINPETGTRNYQVILDALDGLKMECWSKSAPKEQSSMDRYSGLLHFLTSSPLHSPIRITYIEDQCEETIVTENLERISKLLIKYEKIVKNTLDAHDLNAPNKDEDEDGW